jgi:hypothetical protein
VTDWLLVGWLGLALHSLLVDKIHKASRWTLILCLYYYLTTLSVVRRRCFGCRMIDECGRVGGTRISGESDELWEQPPKWHFVRYQTHTICLDRTCPPLWEAGHQPLEMWYKVVQRVWLLFRAVTSANIDGLCGLVARVPGYRSRGPGSIPGSTRFSEKYWSGTGFTQPCECNWGATWKKK